jgi:hypothetical protein
VQFKLVDGEPEVVGDPKEVERATDYQYVHDEDEAAEASAKRHEDRKALKAGTQVTI